MTLDEAIIHAREKAEELRKQYELYDHWDEEEEERANGCLECAREHEQLAEWLTELRKLEKCRECPLIKEECAICGKVINNE